jgi:hypothetical protein
MSSDFCFECGRDLPGDHLGWCSSNAPTPIDFSESTRHARRSDPATSKQAAARLDHTLADHHRVVLDWLDQHGPATDDQIAQAMVDADLTTRTETARRWVRTLREEHDQIAPAMRHGQQIQLPNPSGRLALAWTTRTPRKEQQ